MWGSSCRSKCHAGKRNRRYVLGAARHKRSRRFGVVDRAVLSQQWVDGAIGGVVSGRLAEFEPFVKSVTPALVRHAYSLCRDVQLAQDLVQEALLRMFRYWDRIDVDRNPAAYAHRTVHNLYLTHLERRSSAELPVESFEDRGRLDESAERVHLRIEVSRVLSMLPPRERSVLVARYLDDLSVADTAAALGASEAWVRTTSHRALNRLRAVEAARPAGAGKPEGPVAF